MTTRSSIAVRNVTAEVAILVSRLGAVFHRLRLNNTDAVYFIMNRSRLCDGRLILGLVLSGVGRSTADCHAVVLKDKTTKVKTYQ